MPGGPFVIEYADKTGPRVAAIRSDLAETMPGRGSTSIPQIGILRQVGVPDKNVILPGLSTASTSQRETPPRVTVFLPGRSLTGRES